MPLESLTDVFLWRNREAKNEEMFMVATSDNLEKKSGKLQGEI